MALTKVTKSGITDNAIDADKIENGTILDADITPGTITNAKLAGSIANDKLANSSLTINGSSVSLGSSISAGALDWQAVITADGSTTTTGVAGRGYFINTTNAAHTFTLPGSPTIGATIAIVDYAGTFATNKLTIARNGNNIQGAANNSQISTNRASVTLVYVDATRGWVYQNESNVADLQLATFISATGGTVTTSGNFKIHTFTGDGCFAVATVGNPVGGPSNVDYLVVAGGGGAARGGGAYGSGGGGAGGYRTTFPSPGCNAGSFPISVTTYPITVGAGGAGESSPYGCVTSRRSGSPSVFSTITSAGGGGGGVVGTSSCTFYPGVGSKGVPGGSGGGGGVAGCVPGTGGTGNTPPVSPPQGNPGGNSPGGGGGIASAGGGGAGASGGAPPSGKFGGNGGAGLTNSISTSPVTYAGGGGGGGTNWTGPGSTGGTGGSGGGGAGGAGSSPGPTNNGVSGTANTGGGAGGGGWSAPCCAGSGGIGGKGIVIIRYKFQ